MDEPKTLVGDVRKRRFKKLTGFIKRRPRLTMLLGLLVIAAIIGFTYIKFFNKPPQSYDITSGNPSFNQSPETVIDNYHKTNTSNYTNEQKFTYYYNLASQYRLKGDINKAIENLKKADELKPRHPNVLENLGTLYLQQGDKTQAKNYYQQALSAYNTLPEKNEAVTSAIKRLEEELKKL